MLREGRAYSHVLSLPPDPRSCAYGDASIVQKPVCSARPQLLQRASERA